MSRAANVRLVLDGETIDVMSRREIDAGQPLTFDYNTTEWYFSEPFEDWISGEVVRGFAHAPIAEQQSLLSQDLVAPHIRELWETQQNIQEVLDGGFSLSEWRLLVAREPEKPKERDLQETQQNI